MKKINKDSKLVKWILFLAVIFGAVVYGSHAGTLNTLISLVLFGLAIDFFIKHIMRKRK